MTDFRNTNSVVEVLADWDPQFRSSNTVVEVMADWDPQFRSSNTVVEVMADWDPLFRNSNTIVDVLADWDPQFRVTQHHLEVMATRGDRKQHTITRRPSWREKAWPYFEEPFLPHSLLVDLLDEPEDAPALEEPTEIGNEHWWLDMELGGFFQLQYGSSQFDPQSIHAWPPLETEDKSDVILGQKDGYLRHLDRSVFEDDDFPFTSKVMIGPFLVTSSSWVEGLVESFQGVLTPDSGHVDWELRVHREWENAAKEATTAVATGTWTVPNVNPHVRPRRRGVAFSLLLSDGQVNAGWSIEEVTMRTSDRGKRRFGG